MTNLTAEVISLLEALGKNSKEVAQTLANKGIKGRKRESTSCAIAAYLQEQGIAASVHSYNISNVILCSCGCKSNVSGESICATPVVIKSFIKNFDNGCYPELEA